MGVILTTVTLSDVVQKTDCNITADNIPQQQITDNQTAHVIIIVFACPYLDTVLCKPTRGSTTQVLLSMSEALIQGNLNKSFREFSLGL